MLCCWADRTGDYLDMRDMITFSLKVIIRPVGWVLGFLVFEHAGAAPVMYAIGFAEYGGSLIKADTVTGTAAVTLSPWPMTATPLGRLIVPSPFYVESYRYSQLKKATLHLVI